MKFLADVNVERAVVRSLRAYGYEVKWLAEYPTERRLRDSLLMERAYRDGMIIVTSDREFVDYVFRDCIPTCGVVLLRVALDRAAYSIRTERACNAICTYQEQLHGQFTIVYPDHVERTPLAPEDTP